MYKKEVFLDQINVLSNLSGLRILVVDDCEDNQFLLSHLLKRKGVLISTASNGQEAVEKALSEKFDVILMDIQMPYMDGLEAQKKIKSSGNPVPIFAVTASSQREEKSKILKAGFAAFISKPLNKDFLFSSILSVTQKNSEVLNA